VTPSTKTTGTLVTAAIWNQDVVANTLALKSPPAFLVAVNDSANYTTSSVTFVDIDSAGDPDLSEDIATTGGNLLVHFEGGFTHSNTAGRIYLDFTVNGTRHYGDDGGPMLDLSAITNSDGAVFQLSLTARVTGIVADTYTIAMQWKTTGATATLYAGAGTSNYDVHPQFWAIEIG
jgi:hypothetical protein